MGEIPEGDILEMGARGGTLPVLCNRQLKFVPLG